MARKARSARSREPSPRRGPSLAQVYFETTRRPLACLIFLFPLVATYEFGALILRPIAWPERQLVAQSLIQGLLGWFGAGGVWVPGLALLLTLLIWHIVSRQSWQLRGWVPLLMLAESIVMTAPLFVLNRLALQAIAGDAAESAALAGTGLRIQIVLALGAAIYEELVFRLFLVSVIALLAVDLLKAPQRTADIVAIIVAAVVFALCHVHPVGADPFVWRSFLMRCAAGAYLSVLFIGRGLGICTGCHAAYNLILVALAAG